jgi:hypothetical protein
MSDLRSQDSWRDHPALAILAGAVFFIIGLVSIAGGQTFTPNKSASRRVDRVKEPKLFWLLVALYFGIGVAFILAYLCS